MEQVSTLARSKSTGLPCGKPRVQSLDQTNTQGPSTLRWTILDPSRFISSVSKIIFWISFCTAQKKNTIWFLSYTKWKRGKTRWFCFAMFPTKVKPQKSTNKEQLLLQIILGTWRTCFHISYPFDHKRWGMKIGLRTAPYGSSHLDLLVFSEHISSILFQQNRIRDTTACKTLSDLHLQYYCW